MSVIIMTVVALPAGLNLMSGLMLAAAVSAAASLGLSLERSEVAAQSLKSENSVELCLNNTAEVVGGIVPGKHLFFSGDGVKVIFFRDENGEAAVRVSGHKSREELQQLGDGLAKKIIQQYAYHRLVTEMKARNMNIVEEEVEQDGTVHMRVRVFQG